LILLGLFGSSAGSAQDATIVLEPESPLFAAPDVTSPVLGLAGQGVELPVEETRRVYVEQKPYFAGWHPMMTYTDFCCVRLGDGRAAWVSEDFLYDVRRGVPVPRPVPRAGYEYGPVILLFLLLGCTLLFWRRGAAGRILGEAGILGSADRAQGIAWIVLIRLLLISLVLYFAGGLMIHPTDEQGYFHIARDLLDGRVAGDWLYTIGQGLVLLPHVFLYAARSYYDIVHEVSLFQAVGFGSLYLGFVFLIVERVSGSTRGGIAAALILTVAPFVYVPVEYHSLPCGGQLFKAIAEWPNVSHGSFWVYYLFLWVGHNGMSDLPAACMVLFCVYAVLGERYGRCRIAGIALLFAISCLIRIANILLAPCLAYGFFRMLGKSQAPRREYGVTAIVAVGMFVLGFLPQFIINARFHGGWLHFPYILWHDNRAQEGFAWDTLPGGIDFLIGTNYLYAALGAAGMLCAGNAHQRRILVFWAVPLILFYCGYPVLGTSPIRFILPVYGALVGAAACGQGTGDLQTRDILVTVVAILLLALLVSPVHPFTPPYPFRLQHLAGGETVAQGVCVFVCALTLGLALWQRYCRRPGARFLLLFWGIYVVGQPRLVAVLFVAILLWALATFLREGIRALRGGQGNAALPST